MEFIRSIVHSLGGDMLGFWLVVGAVIAVLVLKVVGNKDDSGGKK